MPRTPLAQNLVDAVSTVQTSTARNSSVARAIEDCYGRKLSRRAFLRKASGIGIAAAGTHLFPRFLSSAFASNAPTVAVVGAGLAGLTCALRLAQAGVSVTVFEGSSAIGGRCKTLRGAFDDGQRVERGGELIDQSHTAIRNLINEVGLDTDNLLRAEKNGTEPLYYFNGAPYTFAEATNDIKKIWQKLHKDLVQSGYPTLYNNFTPRGAQLDKLSVTDWIEQTVPGGMKSRLGQLLDVAYNIEYGGESSEQSSLNLIYLLAYVGQGRLRIFGQSNEKYRIRGGNDWLPARLAAALGARIELGKQLVAVARTSSGRCQLTLKNDGATREVIFDKVVLTVPFSVMRASVDFSQAGFDAVKITAINELGMGTNSKLHLQFASRHWETLGNNGETYSSRGYQNTWDESRGQQGASGLLNNYTGGNIGASFDKGAPASRAAEFLEQIEPVLPGLKAKWNGKAVIDYPTGNPWSRGSYSFWKVGQYTKFAGAEREQQGNCHFAGEHTSIDFQGYLNGAVESGERAANEVLSDWGLRKKQRPSKEATPALSDDGSVTTPN
jgi:monoamine oxidase